MVVMNETERLIYREILPEDAPALFELDSDPEVHRFLGNTPVVSINQIYEVIDYIRKQYIENGTGRVAVIEKASQQFIGWSGLKLVREPVNNHTDFYDLGYRFIRKYWGKGYATESAKASVYYGFNILGVENIYASAHRDNYASRNILSKCGFSEVESFTHYGEPNSWFSLNKDDLENIL